jgi:hypothetical protein
VITKIDTTKSGASSLVYSSYLGGGGSDSGVGVAAGNTGHVYLAGWSFSTDFPTTTGAIQAACVGSTINPFIAKLDTTQSGAASLLYSTCLGETAGGVTTGIAADTSGNAYVTGVINTGFNTFPLVNPIESQGGYFVSKLSPEGTSLTWSTRLGSSSGTEQVDSGAMSLDPSGNIYIVGGTSGLDYPATASSYSPICDPNKGCNTVLGVPFLVSKISQSDGALASLGPWNLAFPETDVNTHSQPLSVYVRDMGSQPFNINSIKLGGANSGDFSVTNDCNPPSQLAAAGQCTITVIFTPTATGTRTATITVDDTAPGSPHVATITGTGASVTFSPASLTFGARLVGQTSTGQTVTLTNHATTRTLTIFNTQVSGGFTETDTCAGAALAPGGTCTITVSFQPTVQGPISGALTVSDTATSSFQSVPLSGTGTVGLAFAPPSLNFGSVSVGASSASKTVTITNKLSTSVTGLQFTASGDYSVTGGVPAPCGTTLKANSSCSVAVTFSPTMNGSIKGAVAVTYSGGAASPQLYSLAGAGTGGVASPFTFSPASLSLVNPVIGTAGAPRTVTATNVSGSQVTITALGSSGNFTAATVGTKPCSGNIAAGTSCTFKVSFNPSSAGTFTDSVQINTTGSVSVVIYGVSGDSLPVSLSPPVLSFPATPVGSGSIALTVTITNNQSVPVTLTTVNAGGDFNVTAGGPAPCGNTLAAKTKCTLAVYFAPTVIGAAKGTLTIAHSAAGSPQTIALTGSGTP